MKTLRNCSRRGSRDCRRATEAGAHHGGCACRQFNGRAPVSTFSIRFAIVMAATMKLTIQELFSRLHHKDARIRLRAARALDNLDSVNVGVVSQLIEFLGSDDAVFRAQAASSLLTIGPKAKAAVPRLAAALSDENENCRFWALQALIRIGSAARPAVPKIKKLLRDEAFGNRAAAARALATLAGDIDATTTALIRAYRNDDNHIVREYVVQSLQRIGSSRAVAALIEALEDEEPRVRSNAAIALKVLGQKAKAAIPALKRFIATEQDEVTRDQAKTALRRMRYKPK